MKPSEEDDEELTAYEHMLVTESHNDIIVEDQQLDVSMPSDDTIYPNLNFTLYPPLHC